jgi:hypothetical protein
MGRVGEGDWGGERGCGCFSCVNVCCVEEGEGGRDRWGRDKWGGQHQQPKRSSSSSSSSSKSANKRKENKAQSASSRGSVVHAFFAFGLKDSQFDNNLCLFWRCAPIASTSSTCTMGTLNRKIHNIFNFVLHLSWQYSVFVWLAGHSSRLIDVCACAFSALACPAAGGKCLLDKFPLPHPVRTPCKAKSSGTFF